MWRAMFYLFCLCSSGAVEFTHLSQLKLNASLRNVDLAGLTRFQGETVLNPWSMVFLARLILHKLQFSHPCLCLFHIGILFKRTCNYMTELMYAVFNHTAKPRTGCFLLSICSYDMCCAITVFTKWRNGTKSVCRAVSQTHDCLTFNLFFLLRPRSNHCVLCWIMQHVHLGSINCWWH